MRYGFTRGVARIEIAAGVIIIVAGAVLAIVAFLILPQYPSVWGDRSPLPPHEELAARVLVAGGLFVAGISIGTAFIVGGQLVLVFLDIRARLARIDQGLRRWEASAQPEPPIAERLRPR